SPRTQSALLQAMQEGRVSIAGQYHPLPRPFHVLATQNPLEQEGTYPLPEAQLDRFLLQIDVDYPDLDAERRMLIATTGLAEQPPRPAMTAAELQAAQRLVRQIPVGDSVVDAILALVRSGRPDEAAEGPRRFVAWGPGPRASRAPPRSRRACMAGAGSARARPFGNSANTSRATRRPASTGGKAPNRSASMSAKPNGRRRRVCGCGAMPRPRWITARPAMSAAATGRPSATGPN